ncbi:hypothetical protein FHQ26_01865 [Testudinibacter sp. TR-2022]|nr:hypothetical protein FHQ22_05060 [Pasteurellaceae bacterium Phil31]TNH10117.1 hypothetical protein FHQ25_06305 [Testudinibacter sp. TR-2022]TNH12497.1 hypothetical protein FHQ26_01865 [Testudinibacter sp. TR-2022]TNH14804.1 hypothetical protein FHQ23_10730 [Testudinibacter sp. TR-2022]TNH16311.1 hypothetical protein FIA56_01750 [Testudinibacter sp. TR-2022]
MVAEKFLTFIETPIFTEDRKALLSEDEYRQFQEYLLEHYDLGDIMPQTGGCREIRWKLRDNHRGKSAGVRIIYYLLMPKERLYLLMMYPKSAKQNLTMSEKWILKQLTAQLKEEK